MPLTIPLLLILSAVLALMLGAAFIAAARRPPRSLVLRRCGFGLLAVGAAVAALSTRNSAPAYVSIIMADTLLAAGLVMLHATTRHLERKQPPRRDYVGWLLVLLVAMLITWYTYPAPDMAARIVVMNGLSAILTGRIAWNVTRLCLGPRGWIGTNILAALLWFLSFVLAVTASFTYISGEPSQDLFNASVPLATLLAVNPLLILFIPLAALLVVRRGQRQDSRDYVRRSSESLQAARDAFMIRCDAAAERARLDNEPLIVAMVDLDNFKLTAAEYGYPIADQVLRWVEKQISADLRVGDEMVRYAIDRFVILMPRMEQEKALLVLDSTRKRIEAGTCTVDGVPIRTTVSIGVARLQPGRTTARELTSAAQLAIYRARGEGRNRIDAANDPYTGFDAEPFARR
jgi:diguanylate cyclase (GGDEF)-like protein